MKFIKKINLKLISIFLVAIFCASTTLTSVTTTAATTSNSAATTIISDVVKAYANNVSKTIASIPYIGTGLQPIFNFLFGELMSTLSAKKGDSSKEIQAKLNQIQKTLSDVSIKQQLSENKSFEDAVNSLNVKCNFDDYFKNINDMIANEYTDTEKYTLRTFLESKGFNIPSEARYLIAGNTKVEARNYAIYKIPLYDLDKSTTEIEDYKYYSYTGGWGGGSTYYNNDKLCYFLDKATSTSDCLATLSDTNEGETVYFDDISDAWSTAIKWCKDGKKVKIKLNDDWIATKYADGTTSFGNGVGFKNGAIWTDCGKANIDLYMDQITLDLNGHKIDRNLTKSIKGGSVIIVERTPLKIIDSSGTNNGLITGGNTTEDGGGIKVCGWASLTVENCKIANNKAQGRGGGVSLYKRYLCTNMGNSSC